MRFSLLQPVIFTFLLLSLPLNVRPATAQQTTEDSAQEAVQDDAQDPKEESRELAKQAARQLQMDHLEDAIELLESALDKDSDNPLALFLGGQAYSRHGVNVAQGNRKAANIPLRRGAELMRKLAVIKQDLTEGEKEVLAISVYNEACCCAIDGESDKALDFLEEAIKLGFSDVDLLAADTDFESVRETERFKVALDSLKKAETTADEPDEG